MNQFKNFLVLSLALFFIHCSDTDPRLSLEGKVTGLTGTLVLKNGDDELTLKKNGSFTFEEKLYFVQSYFVKVKTQPSDQTCVIKHGKGETLSTSITNVKVTCTTDNSDPGSDPVVPVADPTTIAASVSNLALSVNDTGTNAALTGTPRFITITNTGSASTQNLSISPSGLPAGTSITSNTCAGVLAPGDSCVVTITPGASATSSCDTGIVPTPGDVSIDGDNTNAILIDVTILSYGCIYQGGFLFAVDDTTPTTDSIRGKVAALTDQAAPDLGSGGQPTSIIWSSNGNGSGAGDVDHTAILGSDETSTTSTPSPTGPGYPMGTPAFTPCEGQLDGSCNTDNIVSYYNFNRSAGGAAPTPLNDYAAGLCKATINGYSDWYLPAICEMAVGFTCPAQTQNMGESLSFLLGDLNAGSPSTNCNPPMGSECMGGLYWSSTEYSSFPDMSVLVPQLSTSFSGLNGAFVKEFTLGVRCTRSLTL
jgi:hypothetical protein